MSKPRKKLAPPVTGHATEDRQPDSAPRMAPDKQSQSPLFPGWLPPVVGDWIAENWPPAENLADRINILALANAPQMRELWAELSRRFPDRAYIHKANSAFLAKFFDTSSEVQAHKAAALIDLDDADICQRAAYVFLFRKLLEVAAYPGSALTVKEAKAKFEAMRQRAAFLRVEADDTDHLAESNARVDWRSVAMGMRAKADVLDETAQLIPVYRPILTNDRKNRRGIDAALKVSAILEALFSKPFFDRSAKLATMLTGEKTTMAQVRDERPKQNPYASFRQK
ncbi:hypothetical protein [Acidithiobacillus sp.]|uniref:hypothetical protein n=1 Tax=Acidithiobacillus sp. TaxID=1872118 RepID=UPI003D070A80